MAFSSHYYQQTGYVLDDANGARIYTDKQIFKKKLENFLNRAPEHGGCYGDQADEPNLEDALSQLDVSQEGEEGGSSGNADTPKTPENSEKPENQESQENQENQESFEASALSASEENPELVELGVGGSPQQNIETK